MARVLVIEDEPAISAILRIVLTDEGHQVLTAANGLNGIRTLEKGLTPDLIVLDLCMPIMPGREVVTRLQANPFWRTIPVLILTAMSPGSEAFPPVGTYRAVLHKPFDLDRLTRVVRGCTDETMSPSVLSESALAGDSW